MTKYWKMFLAALSGISATTVIAVANAIGVTLSPELAAAVVTIVAAAAVRFGPRNHTPVAEWQSLEAEHHPLTDETLSGESE